MMIRSVNLITIPLLLTVSIFSTIVAEAQEADYQEAYYQEADYQEADYQQADEQQNCGGDDFKLRDLQVEFLHIANQDVSQIMQILASMGYKTIDLGSSSSSSSEEEEESSGYGDDDGYDDDDDDGGGDDQTYSCADLPVVMLPSPINEGRLEFNIGASDDDSGGGGYGDDSGGDSGSKPLHSMRKPHSGETDQILVFYHPSQKQQFVQLLGLVRLLDLRARQIYIEGLVLEVSEDALRETGIKFSKIRTGDGIFEIGGISASPVAAGGAKVLDLIRDQTSSTGAVAAVDPDPFADTPAPVAVGSTGTLLQLQALVADGRAEVLSRPSVLALNNRQAVIQVVDIIQFPIAQSTISASGDIVQSAFTFEEIRPGITLNLRPRVSADNQYVSMEIDVTVEAVVAANNGEVRNADGVVIATKPGASLRRVQTFARINDRTPIIIGGLITEDKSTVKNRVPILGDIPIIGRLFGATQKILAKREVVIVLTPYIVNERGSGVNITSPDDTEMFDLRDMNLFSDSYRLRSEDLFDFHFIYAQSAFKEDKRWAESIIAQRPELKNNKLYRQFSDGNFPGGESYVARMIYDLVKRQKLGEELDSSRFIVSKLSDTGKSEVIILDDLMEQLDDSTGEAIVITYEFQEETLLNSVPSVEIVKVPQETSLDELRQKLRGKPIYGTRKPVAILRSEKDLRRLKAVIATNAIINENGGLDDLTVGSLTRGKIIAIPALTSERFYMIDAQTAKIFTATEDYATDAKIKLEYENQKIKEIKNDLVGDQ
jgi:general secretion pathway protein D